jgi:hypothetical protein
MSLEYIRNYYGVPAKRGARIRYTDGRGVARTGRITAARSARILVLLDEPGPDYPARVVLHPTWQVEYLPSA